MTNLQALADRVEIEALRGEYTDAGMMNDIDRMASLFTEDGVWRIPAIGVDFVTREGIRTGVLRLREVWEFFLQTTHSGIIELNGDTATGRAYMAEIGRMRDGGSHVNYAVFHDTYRRTADGWKFVERVYEIRYADSSPLTGSADPVELTLANR